MNEDIQLRAAAMEFAIRITTNNKDADLVATAELILKFLKGDSNE